MTSRRAGPAQSGGMIEAVLRGPVHWVVVGESSGKRNRDPVESGSVSVCNASSRRRFPGITLPFPAVV